MIKFIKEYRVELFAVLAVALGVFLLVEQLNIRLTVRESIEWLGEIFPQFLESSKTIVLDYMSKFTLSDLLGWLIIISMGIFVAWRVRYRFLRSNMWRSTTCPICGSHLHRIPRKGYHKLLAQIFLPHGRNYRCSNEECSWSGMRHRHSRPRKKIQQYPPEGDQLFK